MAEYIGIKGFTIQSLSSDPPAPVEGQVWYNTTSTVLKGYGKQGTGAWASGNDMNTARYTCQGFGTQTAALCGGGDPAPGAGVLTEIYDGSTWTETADQNTAGKIYRFATGTSQTAGLYMGGEPTSTAVELWNGTSWAEQNDFNTGTLKAGAVGSTTAALKFGGTDPRITNTESYNGTSWSEVNDLVNSTNGMNSAGSQAAALCIGGYTGSITADVEVWDGTCWTEGTNLNTARSLGSSGNGTMTSTAALVAAGSPSYMTNTEVWDGTSWTEVADLANGRNASGGAGTDRAALVFAGYNPPTFQAWTEEWSVPNAIKTFTAT